MLLPNRLYLRRADFPVAADQWNLERQRSGGDDSIGQIRHFGSLDALQGLCHQPIEPDERTWARGIVQRLDQRLTRGRRQPVLLGKGSQFNQADRRNVDEIAGRGRHCQRLMRSQRQPGILRQLPDNCVGIGNDTPHQISSLGKLRHTSR